MINQTGIGIKIGNNKLHPGEYLRFKIKFNTKENLKNLILNKINSSLIPNIKKAFLRILIENL